MKDHYDFLNDYAGGYLSGDMDSDYHIILKRDHSMRVAYHAAEIASHTFDNSARRRTAELAGLYHDISRFEQYTTFKSFNDAVTFDHGDHGAELIENPAITPLLSADERKIISYTTRYHNKIHIPQQDGEKTVFARIVRDADKLDIMQVLIDSFESEGSGLNLTLPDTPDYSPEIVDAVYRGEQIPYSIRKTPNDMKLTMLGWIHDLSFDYSRTHILKMEYMQKLERLLPQDGTIKDLIHFCTMRLESACKRR